MVHSRGSIYHVYISFFIVVSIITLSYLHNSYQDCVRHNNVSPPHGHKGIKRDVSNDSGAAEISYCVSQRIDALTESLPDRLKLLAEVAFDYLTALNTYENESYMREDWDIRSIDTEFGPSIQEEGFTYSTDCSLSVKNNKHGIVERRREKNEEEQDVSLYLDELLVYLMSIVHATQRALVQDMQAGLLTELSSMALQVSGY